MISDLLKNKTSKEKFDIKNKEIIKLDYSGLYEDSEYGIKLEIKDGKVYPNPIGYELYARAWKNGEQVGFGEDGTIEWERFVFQIKTGGKFDNFTHLVMLDPLGNISVAYRDEIVKYREDPKSVVLKTLAHTAKNASKESTNIIMGSIGHTTTTVYPDAGEGGGNVTTDAYVGPNAQNLTWANIRADGVAGIITDGVNGTNPVFMMISSTTSNQWKRLFRSIFTFDTSSIPDTDTISSAVMSIKGQATHTADPDSNTPNIDVYKFTTTGNYNLVTSSDWQEANGMGNTSQTGSPIAYASWSTSAYNDFTFNATGIGNISKTGVSGFALRNANYDVANSAPNWASDSSTMIGGLYADTADVTSDPKLVIVHAAVSGPTNMKTWDGLAKASVKTMDGLAIASVKTWDGLA